MTLTPIEAGYAVVENSDGSWSVRLGERRFDVPPNHSAVFADWAVYRDRILHEGTFHLTARQESWWRRALQRFGFAPRPVPITIIGCSFQQCSQPNERKVS